MDLFIPPVLGFLIGDRGLDEAGAVNRNLSTHVLATMPFSALAFCCRVFPRVCLRSPFPHKLSFTTSLKLNFLHKSIGVVVNIPNNKSGYQTFDVTKGVHQNKFPITFNCVNGLVKFNDENIFIFAWGNRKTKKHKNISKVAESTITTSCTS